ncbi:MAG: hypothetical protein PWQ50_1532 [Methanolobus sp.]|jgi:hypothetical protein|nr:hypothetical protein [Methanolobus sp.]
MEKEFDYYRILKVDYAAYFEFWIMVVPWFFYPILFLPDAKISVSSWTLVTTCISLIGLILLVRRVLFLKYLYIQGADSIGYVISIKHDGYRERQSMIELEHEYQNEKYKILTDLRHSAFYKYHFRNGDNVIIRFDPKKPNEGIVRDAYFSLTDNATSFAAPQLSDSMAENKLTYMDKDLLLSEFVFADVWLSDRIDTILSYQQFIDTIMEFARNNYLLDKKRNRIVLKNNFILKTNASKFADKDIFSLEFRRYYHRIYVVYVPIAFIMSFIVAFSIPPLMEGPRGVGFSWILLLMLFLLPVFLVWMAYEIARGIRNIKTIDYGKEAERVYSEILDAVREKEKDIA